MTDLSEEVEAIWVALEELGWVWVEGDASHARPPRLKPPRSDDPERDAFAREQRLKAIDRKLELVEHAWGQLSPNERKSATGARMDALRLRELLPYDNAISKLSEEVGTLRDQLDAQRERLVFVEAQTSRFASGVWRGVTAIVVGFVISELLADEADWSKVDVAIIWSTVLITWLSVWGFKAKDRL